MDKYPQDNRKRKALLFLTQYSNADKNIISATLAWMCESAGMNFDIYFDSYRLGQHYGGGDYAKQPEGQAFGSTRLAGRHDEQFNLINNVFDVSYIVSQNSAFEGIIDAMGKALISRSDSIFEIYTSAVKYFGINLPDAITMCPVSSKINSKEIDAYCFPEIYFRNTLGLSDDTDDEELIKFRDAGIRKAYCVSISAEKISRMKELGFDVEETYDSSHSNTFANLTASISRNWLDKCNGFFIADPILVSHYIPWLCRNKRLALYSEPLVEIIKIMRDEIKSKSDLIYGRHTDEAEVMELSLMDKSIQIMDPGRPPFTVTIGTHFKNVKKGPGGHGHLSDPTDGELLKYAEEGKVLSTVIFWNPDMRHVETLYELFDLVAIMKFKCGLALTASSYDYSFSSPTDLLGVPLKRGGVYPYVEPLLCSAGMGVAFEAYFSLDKLSFQIEEALRRIKDITGARQIFGWYPAMDGRLTGNKNVIKSDRPWGGYLPELPDSLLSARLEALGFKYAVTQYFRNEPLAIKSKGNFITLNQTAGDWDGWTPLITVKSLSDLRNAESKIVKYGTPGWLVGTIDAPLWLYSYCKLEKARDLKTMLEYLMLGGRSGRLVNATPLTVSRYAQILIDNGYLVAQDKDNTLFKLKTTPLKKYYNMLTAGKSKT